MYNYWVKRIELIIAISDGVVLNMPLLEGDDTLETNIVSPNNMVLPTTLKSPMIHLSKVVHVTQATIDVMDNKWLVDFFLVP